MEITIVDDKYLYFNCPHCSSMVEVDITETNCKIFRHGVYKNNKSQIDPHMNKENCDKLFRDGLIYGCGKPFKINSDNTLAEICDYI